MNGLFDYDNPIMSFIRRASEIFVLNIMWLICSAPLITAGAATAALFRVSYNSADDRGNPLSDFFRYFIKNFRQPTLIWLMAALVGAALIFDWYFFFSVEAGLFRTVGMAVSGFVSIIYAFVLSFAIPLASCFENSLAATLKNAFLLSMANPLASLALCAFNAIPLLLIIFTQVGILLLVIDVGVIAAADGWFFRKIFSMYTVSDESTGEE